MIEKLQNPFVDEVRMRPSEFVMKKPDGTTQFVEIARAMDNEVQKGTITNRAAMQILVDKINELVEGVKPKFAKLAVSNEKFSGQYNILTNLNACGVEAVAATGGYSGLIVPNGITKVRIRAQGYLIYGVFGDKWGHVTTNLVVNGALKPIRTYETVGYISAGACTFVNVAEDAIYTVNQGDVFGLRYTASNADATLISAGSISIEMEVIE